MERRRQTFDEILSNLSRIESEWKDDLAKSVMELLDGIEEKSSYTTQDLQSLLSEDFDAGLTLIRLFLDLSKDELVGSLRESLGGSGIGVKAFREDPDAFLQGLVSLGALEKMREVVGTPATWRDLLVERLKTGRGSAIRAQNRGKFLEDKTEEMVKEVFGIDRYDPDADLPHPLRHRVRQHAVDPDGGQEEGDAAEHREHPAEEAVLPEALLPHLLHRVDLIDRQLGVRGADLPAYLFYRLRRREC